MLLPSYTVMHTLDHLLENYALLSSLKKVMQTLNLASIS